MHPSLKCVCVAAGMIPAASSRDPKPIKYYKIINEKLMELVQIYSGLVRISLCSNLFWTSSSFSLNTPKLVVPKSRKKMSREKFKDLGGGDRGSSHSKVLDSLKSRYPFIHEPLCGSATPDDDRRYLTSLSVLGNREVDGPESPLPPSFSNLMVEQNFIDPHTIKEKITSALKVLRLREPRVLVQFWSPVAVRKRWLLTTWDQPFGLGVADEELYLYRLKSELRAIVVDREHRQELDPPGRVYSQKLPEWSMEPHGLSTRQYAHDGDTCYNFHGYIDLPVFESSGDCCVGVLEIITSSKYVDYAFEVQEVSRALKKQNLKSPNVFEDPSFCVADERRRHELDEIFKTLKMVCDNHNFPLAQTWAVSGYSSSVAISGNLEQSCSSFNRSCIGKVCVSTTDLPFYVRDLSMWEFHEACREQHLDKSQGVVGKSLLSRGTSFCRDVTELSKDEYPLVPIARMSGITSCFAIYVKGLEVDVEYAIEFFLPTRSANETDLRRLVKIVKQQIKNASKMQLDTTSSPQVIGEVPFYWKIESSPSPMTLLTEKGEVPPESENIQPSAENEQNDVDVTFSKKQTKADYVEHMKEDNMENEPSSSAPGGTSQSVVPFLEVGIEDVDINPGIKKRKYTNISKETCRKRKRSESSITIEEIEKHYGKTMDEAAAILDVSRSTLKRICRNLGIPRWPYRNGPYKSDSIMKSDLTDVVVHPSEGAPPAGTNKSA